MIKLQVDNRAIQRRLQRIADRGGNLTKPLNAIGEVMLTSIDRNFEAGGRYSKVGSIRGGSNRWVPLADSTRRNRSRRYGIMQVSGGLARSFAKSVSGNTCEIGSNRPQAAILHGGGKTKPHTIKPRHGKALSFVGAGGRVVTKSVNHPGSNVPGRPILVVQDEDVEEMLIILDRHIEG